MGGKIFFLASCLTSSFHMTTGAGVTAHGVLGNSNLKLGFTYFKTNVKDLKLGTQLLRWRSRNETSVTLMTETILSHANKLVKLEGSIRHT